MNRLKMAVMAAAACAVSSFAVARDSFLVAPPGQLPAAARIGDAADMFLFKTVTGRRSLYIESSGGERLYTLDVTDPAHVADLGSAEIAARGPFLFGALVGTRSVLMHHGDGTHALMSFANERHPAVSEPAGLAQASVFDARNSELPVTVTAPRQLRMRDGAADATGALQVIDLDGGSAPRELARIGNVRRRLTNAETDTQFFLVDQGITMVRDREAEFRSALLAKRYEGG